MTLPSLSALRAFDAAARHLSLSRAGDELHVTYAAVSHQVRNLEDSFGAPLFHRNGRGIRLTPLGQTLFTQISPLFESMTDACRRVKAAVGGGSLTVGCVPSIARWFVPNLILFSKQHPEADIRVVYAQRDDRLALADLDILISCEGQGEGGRGVVREPLFSCLSRPVCSPAFLQEHGPFDEPRQIAAAALLHHQAPPGGWKAWCGAAGLGQARVDTGMTYEDFSLLTMAVMAGHGIALCPVNVFRSEIARGDLVVVSDIAIDAHRGYSVLTRQERPPIANALVQWFVDKAREPGFLF